MWCVIRLDLSFLVRGFIIKLQKFEDNFCEKEELGLEPIVKPMKPSSMAYMANIKKIAQEAIRNKGLTEEQVRKILGIRKYETNNQSGYRYPNLY